MRHVQITLLYALTRERGCGIKAVSLGSRCVFGTYRAKCYCRARPSQVALSLSFPCSAFWGEPRLAWDARRPSMPGSLDGWGLTCGGSSCCCCAQPGKGPQPRGTGLAGARAGALTLCRPRELPGAFGDWHPAFGVLGILRLWTLSGTWIAAWECLVLWYYGCAFLLEVFEQIEQIGRNPQGTG